MKLLMAILLVTATLTASAQRDNRRVDGRIVLRDGRSTVLINLSENDPDTNRRLRNLEQAVRDLQDQVYDLRDVQRTRTVTTHVCSITTNFDGTFVGRASSRVEAEAIARNNCEKARASFCTNSRVTPARCEVVQEEVAI